jgi:hypothetical protein
MPTAIPEKDERRDRGGYAEDAEEQPSLYASCVSSATCALANVLSHCAAPIALA